MARLSVARTAVGTKRLSIFRVCACLALFSCVSPFAVAAAHDQTLHFVRDTVQFCAVWCALAVYVRTWWTRYSRRSFHAHWRCLHDDMRSRFMAGVEGLGKHRPRCWTNASAARASGYPAVFCIELHLIAYRPTLLPAFEAHCPQDKPTASSRPSEVEPPDFVPSRDTVLGSRRYTLPSTASTAFEIGCTV